jgi:hypothetical protein
MGSRKNRSIWTYLVNDEKISAIGSYLRDHSFVCTSRRPAVLVGVVCVAAHAR